MSLVIAIVNYRCPELTLQCLRSLADEIASSAAHVIVADNDSGDGSAERISQGIQANGWQSWASVLPLPRNGGFSYGNNACIRQALASMPRPKFVLLLNPDTLVKPGAIGRMIEFLDSHPRVGIVGCSLEGPDGEPQFSAHRFPSPLGELESASQLGPLTRTLARFASCIPYESCPFECDWVSGSCMMIRTGVFDSIGLMDEGYFLYFDEVDFCAGHGRPAGRSGACRRLGSFICTGRPRGSAMSGAPGRRTGLNRAADSS